jgi:hypothetical protein
MLGLVLLEGDDSSRLTKVAEGMLDGQRLRAAYHYLPIVVTAEQMKAESQTLAAFGWPLPAVGEIVLVALDGEAQQIAAHRIRVDSEDAALASSDAFLKQHQTPAQDALALVAEARKEAAASQRRVWLVEGGPRCGPCFRLARWMEDHHQTLDKDYVIVKLMQALDENVGEALKELPRSRMAGIPWFAITEPDGKVLINSEGPLGNLGFPTTVEDLRHVRTMLERTAKNISAQEVDELVQSLAPAN